MGVWLSSIVAFTSQLGNAIELLSFSLYMNASMRKKKFTLKILRKMRDFKIVLFMKAILLKDCGIRNESVIKTSYA